MRDRLKLSNRLSELLARACLRDGLIQQARASRRVGWRKQRAFPIHAVRKNRRATADPAQHTLGTDVHISESIRRAVTYASPFFPLGRGTKTGDCLFNQERGDAAERAFTRIGQREHQCYIREWARSV